MVVRGGATTAPAFFIFQIAGATYATVSATTKPATDTWHYYAATWDGATTTLKIYLDGSNEGTTSTTSGSAGCSEDVDVGRRGDNASFSWVNGNIQEVAIYNSVLTSTRITAHYNAGIASPSTGQQPFTVKRPELPRFRNPDYWDRFVSRGYNTGLFAEAVLWPRMVGWFAPFSVVPNGLGQ
jgi:hypothetical protein